MGACVKMLYKLGVCGADGRIGRLLVEKILEEKQLSLVAAVVEKGSPTQGKETGQAGVLYKDSFLAEDCDLVIDFSTPQATQTCLEYCLKQTIPLIIGTTGHSQAQQDAIMAASKEIAILQSANMSTAVNTCINLISRAAKMLGEEYDIELLESHHRYKVDAPSGTALAMGKAAAKALGKDFEQVVRYEPANFRQPRQTGSIGMQSIRGGQLTGEHEVFFIGDNETVTISHKAYSRDIFVVGAIRAAKWLIKNNISGIYTMEDTLK